MVAVARGMMAEQNTVVDELQMRVFWRRWNECVTGAPGRREGPAYDASYVLPTVGGDLVANTGGQR